MYKLGLLDNEKIKRKYNEIYSNKKFCNKCKESRKEYEELEVDKYKNISEMYLGFSSTNVCIPIDVLIVSESNGGGKKKTGFTPEMSLQDSIKEINNYYRNDDIIKFNQYQVRELLNYLDEMKFKWVFTDLVKCFVEKNTTKKLNIKNNSSKKVNNIKGKSSIDNFKEATKYCSMYLEEQIRFLKPKYIICLGEIAFSNTKRIVDLEGENANQKNKPGHSIKGEFNNINTNIIYSYLPCKNTADLWVSNNGWNNIICALK